MTDLVKRLWKSVADVEQQQEVADRIEALQVRVHDLEALSAEDIGLCSQLQLELETAEQALAKYQNALPRWIDEMTEMCDRIEALKAQLATARADALREVRDSALLPRFAGEGLNGLIEHMLNHPAPAPKPKQFEFDHPYSAIFKDGLSGRWLELRSHDIPVASYAVASWGSEPACIEAAWRHAYGDPAPTPAQMTWQRLL